MTRRVFASALLAAFGAACGGDGKITEPQSPQSPAKVSALAAIGTDPVTGATIETNKDDYAPGEVVHLVGRGWAPNETVHLFMTEEPDTHGDVSQDVQADSTGAFSLHFYDVQEHDLGVTFTLRATGQTSGSVATAVFTDGRAIDALTLTPVSPVLAGTSVSVAVRVVLNPGAGPTTWKGTKWEIRNSANVVVATSPAPCLDTDDHALGDPDTFSGNKHEESFGFTAGPADTYTLSVSVYSTDNCAVAADATTATTAFTVAASNTAPVLDLIGNKSVDEGSELSFVASATDTDTPAQVLTFSLVGAPVGATINSGTGAFSWTPTDGPAQTATFTVRVTDNGSPTMSDEEEITVTVKNVAPTATFNAPASVDEGSPIALSLTGPADPSPADVAAGFTYAFDCGSGYGAASSASTASCPTSDNGTRTVKGKILDKDGGFTEYSASVTINNVVPAVGAITAPTDPVKVGIAVLTGGSFTDAGTGDTHTAVWSWGDGSTSAGVVTETSGSGSVSGSHVYTTPGVYTVVLTVTDDDGGSGQSTYKYVVVYDPNAGFVTGGGWINSPASAYRDDVSLTGKATFGFVSKYKKGMTVPEGNTEFQFHAGNLNFKSSSYQWLVVTTFKGVFKGTGTINGSGTYGFMLSAIDGQINGGGGFDKFRIKIWHLNPDGSEGDTIYDNQYGADIDAAPTTTLEGGSIVIHSK